MNQCKRKRGRWAMLVAAIVALMALVPAVAGLGEARAQGSEQQVKGTVKDNTGNPVPYGELAGAVLPC